ncbi:hypothetical protein BH11CYA1_BH11CYA1_11570 [soil metagenome]
MVPLPPFVRGDIWFADLSTGAQGREIFKSRPVVIIANPVIIRQGGSPIAVVPISDATTKLLSDAPVLRLPNQHVLIPGDALSGLDKLSVAMCEQIRAVDRGRFQYRKGKVDSNQLEQIAEAMTFTLDLFL